MPWPTKKLDKSEIGRGGDGGGIFIASRKIVGGGKITVDGGDGDVSGAGGKATIISEDNQFTGQISAKGGKSLPMFKKWWENSLVQVVVLVAAILGIITFFFIFRK